LEIAAGWSAAGCGSCGSQDTIREQSVRPSNRARVALPPRRLLQRSASSMTRSRNDFRVDPARPTLDPEPVYQPDERFWPYVDLPEQPTTEELVALEYREVGSGEAFRSRARFQPEDVLALRDLFDIVGRHDGCTVLVDDVPVPYARELWLPLLWYLLPR
jgi:hypothetical protein